MECVLHLGWCGRGTDPSHQTGNRCSLERSIPNSASGMSDSSKEGSREGDDGWKTFRNKVRTWWTVSDPGRNEEAGKERQHPHAEWRSIHRKGSTVAEGSFKGSFKTATPSVGHIFSDGGLTHVGVVEDAPRHLQTERGRWWSLVATCAACSFASGPVGAWPTIEPLFIAAGLFPNGDEVHTKKHLDMVFSMAVCFQLGGSLPAGWLYDRYGGERCALWGGAGASIGLILMALSCFFPEHWSWLLYIGYPLAQFAGQINTYAIFSFVWLIPDHQNLILSCVGGVQCLSDTVALAAVGLNSCCGLFIGTFLSIIALLSVTSGIVGYLIVPNPSDFGHFIEQSLGEDFDPYSDEDEEDNEDEKNVEKTVDGRGVPGKGGAWATVLKPLRRSFAIIAENPYAVTLLIIFSTVYCISILWPIQEMLYYYQALFPEGSHAPQQLVNIWAITYGTCGFLCALFLGALCDSIGIVQFVTTVAGVSIAVTALLSIRSLVCQVVAQLGLTVGISMYLIIVNRFAMLYAPPKLFGTLGGLIFTVVALLVTLTMQVIANAYKVSDISSEEGYQVVFAFFGIASGVMGAVMGWWWHTNPPPAVIHWKHQKYEEVADEPASHAGALDEAREQP